MKPQIVQQKQQGKEVDSPQKNQNKGKKSKENEQVSGGGSILSPSPT